MVVSHIYLQWRRQSHYKWSQWSKTSESALVWYFPRPHPNRPVSPQKKSNFCDPNHQEHIWNLDMTSVNDLSWVVLKVRESSNDLHEFHQFPLNLALTFHCLLQLQQCHRDVEQQPFCICFLSSNLSYSCLVLDFLLSSAKLHWSVSNATLDLCSLQYNTNNLSAWVNNANEFLVAKQGNIPISILHFVECSNPPGW